MLLLLLAVAAASPLDPDALSQRYRNWHYYPDYIIPPICLNPFTCKTNTSQATTDVFQVWSTPESPNVFRAVYLQYDGVGYETYMATSTDLLHFDLASPTLAPGQPGVIFSPRAGRPPLDGQPKPLPGEFDFGGITFIGPLLENYTVGAPSVLRRTSKGVFWYAYGAYPTGGYESAPGADGLASSPDGLAWTRASPTAFMDTRHGGAGAWESAQVYAPFLFPALDGSLGDFYNAGRPGGVECSGAAYLPGGVEALPGVVGNVSQWVRDPANPLLPNDANASYQASDPKIFWDAEQGVWINLYFCNGDYKVAPYAGGANICIAFSTDQRSWAKASTPLYAHGGHPKGLDEEHAHKVWLTAHPSTGVLYMYYTGVNAKGRGCVCSCSSAPVGVPLLVFSHPSARPLSSPRPAVPAGSCFSPASPCPHKTNTSKNNHCRSPSYPLPTVQVANRREKKGITKSLPFVFSTSLGSEVGFYIPQPLYNFRPTPRRAPRTLAPRCAAGAPPAP